MKNLFWLLTIGTILVIGFACVSRPIVIPIPDKSNQSNMHIWCNDKMQSGRPECVDNAVSAVGK